MYTIDTNDLEQIKSLAESRKRQNKRQNEWNKQHYKRISVAIPNDLYEQILNKYSSEISMNGYLTRLIKQDLDIQDT